MRWFYRAIGGGAWPVMRSHVSWCTKAMRVSLLRQKQYYVVWDDGEPKCEIMVASSVWEGAALWFDVSLLITTTGPVRVGCVPLLFCTVIWCLTRRPGCYMSHMSATGITEFMKASVDGGVQDTAWVFAASRDPSIQTRTKKRRGRVFSRAAGRGVWHSLFEARRQEGKQANKGWAT